jgi:hypothetical protein
MKIIRVQKLFILFVLFVLGCATTGPVFTPTKAPDGKALIYFYRPSAFTLSGRTIFMAFPGSDHSYSMTNGGYYPLVVNPGTVSVTGVGTDIKPVKFTIDVKKGDERYVIVAFSGSLGLTVPAEFQEVPAEKGKAEISKCNLISETK